VKRSKSIYTLSLAVFLFLVVGQVYGEKNVIKSGGSSDLSIWTEKEDFLVYEPIWTYMRLTNNSAETLFINASSLPQGLRVKAIRGREVSQYFHSGSTGRPGTKPGESFVKWVDLSGWWGIVKAEISDGWRFIPAGRYKVWIEKHCPQAESNVIKSDTVEITVSEPKGEELAAWNLLTEASRLWGRDREVAYKKFEELVEKYPHSVYAPKALDRAAECYIYVDGEEEKALQKFRELLEKYPESPYYLGAIACIEVIYENDKDKAGALREMKELMKKHPNGKIADRVRRGIQYIEKW